MKAAGAKADAAAAFGLDVRSLRSLDHLAGRHDAAGLQHVRDALRDLD
jgi:hypothetical protein